VELVAPGGARDGRASGSRLPVGPVVTLGVMLVQFGLETKDPNSRDFTCGTWGTLLGQFHWLGHLLLPRPMLQRVVGVAGRVSADMPARQEDSHARAKIGQGVQSQLRGLELPGGELRGELRMESVERVGRLRCDLRRRRADAHAHHREAGAVRRGGMPGRHDGQGTLSWPALPRGLHVAELGRLEQLHQVMRRWLAGAGPGESHGEAVRWPSLRGEREGERKVQCSSLSTELQVEFVV